MEFRLDHDYFKGTISISLVHEALLHVQQKGYDTLALLQKAGITPELLHSDKTRVSVTQYAQLWIVLADAMNDEFFGMDSHPMRRGSYTFLSKSVIQSTSLKQALTQILQFLNLVLDDFNSKFFVEEHYAYIVIQENTPPKRMFSYATYLMLIQGLMCWLCGQRIVLNRIQLRCVAPSDDHDYKVRFCDDIQYGSEENYIQFDANYLNLPIKQDQKSWHQFILHTPYNLLVRYKNPNALSHQIRKHFMQTATANWKELSELAPLFNMSEATMQRRLKHEGINFQQLKNDIRRDLAIDLLAQSHLTLQDISEQLNFHDASAFHRAFKKWTGVNPGSYRQKQQHKNTEV